MAQGDRGAGCGCSARGPEARRPPEGYPARHPELFEATAEAIDVALEPSLLRLLHEAERDGSCTTEALLEGEKLERMAEDISFLRVFTGEWCQKLAEEVRHFQAWCRAAGGPSADLAATPVIAADMGLRPVIDALVRRLRPLAAALLPEVGGATLDSQHSFVQEYSAEGTRDLAYHVDSGEVTLNVCLEASLDLAGSAIYFEGRRCNSHLGTGVHGFEEFSYDDFAEGQGIIHAGAARHGTREITAGRRMNLIVLMRSSTYAAERGIRGPHDCPGWCGVERHGPPPAKRRRVDGARRCPPAAAAGGARSRRISNRV